jgi:hypothetical protein
MTSPDLDQIVAINEKTGHELVLAFDAYDYGNRPEGYVIVAFINRTTQEIREQALYVERFRRDWRETARRRMQTRDQDMMVPHTLVSYVYKDPTKEQVS